jgi:hypothetical protein
MRRRGALWRHREEFSDKTTKAVMLSANAGGSGLLQITWPRFVATLPR